MKWLLRPCEAVPIAARSSTKVPCGGAATAGTLAYIAEIDRRVEAEPDLEKRIGILKEALELYPGEPHFEGSLRLETEKRDLVVSIVSRARTLEQRGQFAEALGQWEILRTIYSQYPGLSFEIERIGKRRGQQVRSDAKARWVELIDASLRSSDCSRALDLLQQAKAEFPHDPELAELEKLAEQGTQRSAEASQLLAEGQDHWAQGRFDEGLECLRTAHKRDEGNALVRAVLLESLVERARSVLDTDWHSAEVLAQQALDLDPNHTQARSLRTLALDRKQRALVDKCLSLVRRLEAAGDLDGALAQLEQGLTAYPREPSLLQLSDTLQKESSQFALRQAHRRDLDEMRRLERRVEATTDVEALKTLCNDATVVAQRYPDDAEFQSLATKVGQRLASVTRLFEGPATARVEAAPLESAPALSGEPSGEVLPAHRMATEGGEALEGPKTKVILRTPLWVPAAVFLALVVVAVGVLGVVWYRHRHRPAPQLPPNPPPERVHLAELPLRTMPLFSVLPPVVPLPNLAKVQTPKKPRVTKPLPAPPEHASGGPTPEMGRLYDLAREACTKGNYVEPQEESAIVYAKRALALDPKDEYAKRLLEIGVQGGKYRVDQAIKDKDFVTAHRVADALAQLLPGRNDIAETQNDITYAEAADAMAHRQKPPPPAVSVRVLHLHSGKPQGPHCQGTLSVIGDQMSFTPESTSDGHMHPMRFACSEIREIKKNSHILGLGHHDDFHVRTTSGDTINFLPEHPPFAISALQSACSK